MPLWKPIFGRYLQNLRAGRYLQNLRAGGQTDQTDQAGPAGLGGKILKYKNTYGITSLVNS